MTNSETIIIEFPCDLKGMADAVQAFLSEVKKVRADHSKGGGAVDYERVENRYSSDNRSRCSSAGGARSASIAAMSSIVGRPNRSAIPISHPKNSRIRRWTRPATIVVRE